MSMHSTTPKAAEAKTSNIHKDIQRYQLLKFVIYTNQMAEFAEFQKKYPGEEVPKG